MRISVSLAFLCSLISVSYACANDNLQIEKTDFNIVGSEKVTISVNPKTNSSLLNPSIENLTGVKVIQLLKVIPTEEFLKRNKSVLQSMSYGEVTEKDYSNGIKPLNNSQYSKNLGMNEVPVFNQGNYGTCATFASTAALDALIKKGDYISQQCFLALSVGLGNSLWDGAKTVPDVLNPLKTYGIVSQENCSTEYADESQELSPAEYSENSEKIRFTFYKESANLTKLKGYLNAGHRAVIGFHLNSHSGEPGVKGFDIKINGDFKKVAFGLANNQMTLITTAEIQNAGHAVLVIGYDDKQRLLKIRNSWGDGPGDDGDFYMTYTYFNAMAAEQTEIR